MTEQSTSEGFLFVGPDQILEQHVLFNLCRGSRGTLRLIYYSVESKPSVKGVGGIVLCLHKLFSFILNLMTKDCSYILKLSIIICYTLSPPFIFLTFDFEVITVPW